MARNILMAGAGVLIGLVIGAAVQGHAEEQPTDDTLAAAAQAGVPVDNVEGALNSLADAGIPTDPWTYLRATGEIAPQVALAPALSPVIAACDWPICGPLGQRLWCIEAYESHHNGAAVNRSSGAAGWLQWLPGTARTWGVVIGNRWSEWNAAAQIAALGQRFFTSQWVPLQRGLC